MNTQKKKDQFTTFIQSISLRLIYNACLRIFWLGAACYQGGCAEPTPQYLLEGLRSDSICAGRLLGSWEMYCLVVQT